MTQLIRQHDAPSMIRNGNFGAGLAGWVPSSGVVHGELESTAVATAALINSPRFFAKIVAGGHIDQVLNRSDAFRYPSRRFVEFLDAIPIGINTLNLRPSGLTTVDGVPVNAGVDPFSFTDPVTGEVVSVRAGAQVEVDDLDRQDLSGPFRVGRSFVEGGGTLITVQASPINGTILHLAEHTDFAGATYTHDSVSGFANIEVIGINPFDRKLDQNSQGLVGPQPGDVVIVTQPKFAVAMIMGQVQVQSDRYQLQVVPVTNAPFLDATNDASNPSIVTTEAITEWFITPQTRVSLIRELPVFQFDLTLAYSYFPSAHDGNPMVDVVGRDGKVVESIPMHVLENGGFAEDLSVSESPNLTSVYRRRLHRFYREFLRPPAGLLRVRVRAGQGETDVGDVVLYKGNFTRRHDFDDRDDPSVAAVADRRVALDRMLHGVDEAAGLVPRGATVLYAGGATCPPGYKRVDALPLSDRDGLETIPAPDSVAYEEDRNRTVMAWDNQSFDLLDAQGRPIPIVEDSEVIQVVLPPQQPFGGAFETIEVGPVQQRIQPGMSLRIRASDVDTREARRFDHSTVVRQAFVERIEVAGNDPASGITYPLFMSGGQFDPEERNFDPIGPPDSGQPTTYSSTNAPASPFAPPLNGTVANPASFSGLVHGAPTMTVTGVQILPLAVGEVVYVRWSTGTGPFQQFSGAFVARVVANDQAGNVTVERADGNAMVVSGSTTAVSGTASFSDALLFESDVVVTRTSIDQDVVWSARRFQSSFKLTVFGNVEEEMALFNQSGVVVEPSGFLRYGDPVRRPFDRGSMGHSHEIIRGDAPFNENIAPHVSLSFESVTPSVVARRHGHGHMPKFIFPIPRFVAYLLCERL